MGKRDELLAIATIAVLIVAVVIFTFQENTTVVVEVPRQNATTENLLDRAYKIYGVQKQGIIHIGARYADELPVYKKYGIKDILWIEADPTAKAKLILATALDPGSKIAIFAATDTNGTISLHKTTNDGYSSSIFKLKNHLKMSPDVLYDQSIVVPQRRLDDYLSEQSNLKGIKYNFIVIDVQGAELVALKGAIQTLQNIDAIIAEVNHDELYEGGVYINDLDKFLLEQNFIRVDSVSCDRGFGDALYVKADLARYN